MFKFFNIFSLFLNFSLSSLFSQRARSIQPSLVIWRLTFSNKKVYLYFVFVETPAILVPIVIMIHSHSSTLLKLLLFCCCPLCLQWISDQECMTQEGMDFLTTLTQKAWLVIKIILRRGGRGSYSR
jgi:hypothetical protein